MKSKLYQSIGILAILLFTGAYAHAGIASLQICNKGDVTVFVVLAKSTAIFFLDVSGWTDIHPGECKLVIKGDDDEHYIGFGYANSHVAAHVDQVPDFGWDGFKKVLTRSDKQFCVRDSNLSYRTRDVPTIDCSSLRYGSNDPGGYYPFKAALYFRPESWKCDYGPHSVSPICYGGNYYLNVEAKANSIELRARLGSKSGNDESPAEPGIGEIIIRDLAKEIAEERKAKARAQAAGRERVTVCVPESLIEDWRNSPPGSKMDRFKQHFVRVLRIHGEDPSSDMTEWWWIDPSIYAENDPDTPFNEDNVVISDMGGSCGAGNRKQTLAIGKAATGQGQPSTVLGDAGKESSKNVQKEALADARVKQNVCISDDLTTEWKNPSAGGKMETLKRLLIQSFRERANTPGYDQTLWFVVDSRYYSAWIPGDSSWGKLVHAIPGGRCNADRHREILLLAP